MSNTTTDVTGSASTHELAANNTIWKFLIPAPKSVITVPAGAKFISAGAQGPGENIVAWAEVNPENPGEEREIQVVPTGGELPQNRGVFIGTVQMPSTFAGQLVFHLYESCS